MKWCERIESVLFTAWNLFAVASIDRMKKNVCLHHPSDCRKKTQSHWVCTVRFAFAWSKCKPNGNCGQVYKSQCSSMNRMCSFGMWPVVCVHECNFGTYSSQANICIKRTSSRERTNYTSFAPKLYQIRHLTLPHLSTMIRELTLYHINKCIRHSRMRHFGASLFHSFPLYSRQLEWMRSLNA